MRKTKSNGKAAVISHCFLCIGGKASPAGLHKGIQRKGVSRTDKSPACGVGGRTPLLDGTGPWIESMPSAGVSEILPTGFSVREGHRCGYGLPWTDPHICCRLVR